MKRRRDDRCVVTEGTQRCPWRASQRVELVTPGGLVDALMVCRWHRTALATAGLNDAKEQESGFECRIPGCTRSALLGSYYCKEHDVTQ